MNVIIDVGNTFIKLAAYKDSELQEKVVSEKIPFLDVFEAFETTYGPFEHGIVSSVGGFSNEQLKGIQEKVSLLVLDHRTKVPFQNKYATPTTLGVDRIALASAAVKKCHERNVLVIDAGSCITYDFISAEGVYFGGAISPGLEMRYKAMNTFTANLPLLTKEQIDYNIGDTTEKSMHAGVIQGVAGEIDGFISQYAENHPDLTVILTGGDAHFLRDRIKNDIFANSNFLLDGLNYILELNID